MPKSFSATERENIKKKLTQACRASWTLNSYKKTSVDELCKSAGISKGAFYLFFDSKEEIFCEVLCEEQQKIYDTASVLMQEKPEKTGIINALKYIYREYDQNNFLYHSDSADYMILLKKLKPGQLEKICRLEEMNQRLFLDVPHLRRKISDELTTSVIYSLLMGVKQKDVLENHMEVFDFLVEKVVEDIYED